MTPEQLEDLAHLIADPDWDVSERNDAWEFLKILVLERAELSERLSATKSERDALSQTLSHLRKVTDGLEGK